MSRLQTELHGRAGTRRVDDVDGVDGVDGDREDSTNTEGIVASGDDTGTGGEVSNREYAGVGETEC